MLHFALCGSYLDKPEYNPYQVAKHTVRQKILLLINSKPKSLVEIASKLNLDKNEVKMHIEALEKCGLVKKLVVNGITLYAPAFAIFTLEDQRKLQPLIEELSEDVVAVVSRSKKEVHETINKLECTKSGYEFPDLDYIIVGAYTLDYEGLEVLSEEGFLIVSKQMPGGNYVFTGLEKGLVNLREAWMWGHNGQFGRYVFSTHGKLPPGGRRAFPDITWFWISLLKDRKFVEEKMIRLGDILYALLKDPHTFNELNNVLKIPKSELLIDLTLLWELDYINVEKTSNRELAFEFKLNRPVFTSKDIDRIKSLSEKILRKFVDKSLKPKYSLIEEIYENTSPAKHQIDIKEAFNHLYHLIFEGALDKLISKQVLSEPPLRKDGGKYSTWVSIGEV